MKTAKFGKEISNTEKAYKSSFMDMPDKTIYWDPCAFRTNDGVDLKSDFYEEWEEKGVIERFDELQEKGYPLDKTMDTIHKELDVSTWDLPAWFMPDIHIVNPEVTPAADLIARETTDKEQVKVTRQDGNASASWSLDDESDGESTYSYSDGSYSTNTYDVVGYGLATRMSDKLILANDPIRNTQGVAETAQINAMRQAEEAQILKGTANDSDGFSGFKDKGNEYEKIDVTTSSNLTLKKVRELIDKVEYEGGDRSNIAVFTDFETHRILRSDIDDEVRYSDPGEKLDAGFETFTIDNCPVLKTHGLGLSSDATSSGDAYIFAVDMGSVSMRMLQDTTIKPLAKVGPQEQVAADAYGTLAMEAPAKIQYIAHDGS